MCSGTGERFRIFRAEKTYAVKAGRWYFEFEAVTAGDMRVGWSRPGCQPDLELGSDDRAFAFDGFKVSSLLSPGLSLLVCADAKTLSGLTADLGHVSLVISGFFIALQNQ